MQTEIEFPNDISTEAHTNMKARSRRRKKLLGFISDNGMDMEEPMLMARYAINHDIKSGTAKEYLRELIDAEYVFRCDGHVVTLVDHEKLLKKSFNSSKKSSK